MLNLDPRLECDEDGWVLQVNDEPKYPTFFHQFSPALIQSLLVKGKIEVSYVGFGEKGTIIFAYVTNDKTLFNCSTYFVLYSVYYNDFF